MAGTPIGPPFPALAKPRVGNAVVWRTFRRGWRGEDDGRFYNPNTTHGACPVSCDAALLGTNPTFRYSVCI